MGIYLLNISVDTTDTTPEYLPENLSINDQESLVEIIVEQALGFENTFCEYDDPDTEDNTKKKNSKIDLVVLFPIERTSSEKPSNISKQRYPKHDVCLTNGYSRLTSPPPKI
ncbi:MAG: hypothetical protein M3142_09530 [Bacteroidota bacterium]|nr:hypothetical protein [Bacteroidota bacterium]